MCSHLWQFQFQSYSIFFCYANCTSNKKFLHLTIIKEITGYIDYHFFVYWLLKALTSRFYAAIVLRSLLTSVLLLFIFCADTSAQWSNAHQKGKVLDSLRYVYTFRVDERANVKKYLEKEGAKDAELLAFLQVLEFSLKLGNVSQAEIDDFYTLVGVDFKRFPNVQARAYRSLGFYYFVGAKNYERAFDAYIKLEKLLKVYNEGVITDYSIYCGDIVTAYYRFKNYSAAIDIAKLGLLKATNKWDLYNTMGLCYRDVHKLDSALLFLHKGLQEAKDKKMPFIYQSISFGNIGNVHYLQKDYSRAKPLLQLDLDQAVKIDDKGLAAGAAIPLADILITEGKLQLADDLLNTAKNGIEATKQYDRLEFFYPVRSRFFERKGWLNKALLYKDSAILAVKRNDSVYNSLLVMKAQQRMDMERIAVEKNKLEAYKKLSETKMLALLAIFIIVVAFYLYVRKYKIRIAQDKEKIAQLNRIMELRQKLSADMHDDIGSTLSSISIYAHSLLMGPVTEDAKSVLEKIKVNAQNVQENISDIIWSVNPKMDNMEQVLARMRAFGADITEHAKINFNFNVSENIYQLVLDMEMRKNIYLIYKEVINNAVKYSNAAQITVNATAVQNVFILIIADDGCGFNIAKITMGNGLNNIVSRAKEIGGAIDITADEGRGTTVKFTKILYL